MIVHGLVEARAAFDGRSVLDGPVAIRVENGRISALGRSSDFPADEARVVVDLGATLMPGLIDTHVHLELSAAEERHEVRARFEENLAAGRLAQVARRNAEAALASGVTTLRDCGSTESLFALRDGPAGDDAAAPWPRIVATGRPITTRGGQLCWLGLVAEDEAAVRAAARRLLSGGSDALKVMASGGFLTAESDPYRPQYGVAALRAAVEQAHARGKAVVAHATAAAATVGAALAGVDSIDHAGWYVEDGSERWTDDELGVVVASGATVGLTAAGRLRRLLDEPDGRAAIRDRAAAHRRLAEFGARIGVHSDAGGSRTPFDGFADSLRVAAIGLDRSPIEVLRMATSEAASELGLAGEVGSLAPGHRADLLLVDGDPTADLSALARVRLVVRDGCALIPAATGEEGKPP